MQLGEPVGEPVRVRLVWYAALVTVCVAYLVYNFRLHRADLCVPLAPAKNDSAALLSLVTSIHEDSWPWIVTRVGAPGTAERYDYPLPEHAHYLAIQLIGQFTSGPFETFNWWCLLSYPLTALSAMGVLRACGLSRPVGFALAMVYTLLPYHAGRVFTHTMLAHYETVPLAILPAVWITVGRLPFFSPPGPDGRRSRTLMNSTTGWSVLIAILVAASSPYYAFFGNFFLIAAGLYRSLNEVSWRPLCSGIVCAVVVAVTGFLCSLPFLVAQWEHGANPAVAVRSPNEAEVYCLKVTQLVLPSGDHRIAALGHMTRVYNVESPNSNENRDSVLGAVAAVGFLVLLGRLLIVRYGPTLLSGLAVLNVFALLLGASGGFGGLFNFLVFPQVRCYNRLCVFIAFWSLLAVGLLVDRWAARGWSGRAVLAAIGLLVFGLWDITSVRQAPRHSDQYAQHREWKVFVADMEAAMPAGGMVFQLPAASYPEGGVVHRMPDYAHLACHAYSRSLHWSYGTNRNRRWDEWHQYVAGLAAENMVRCLCIAGFSGVYVDRRGYADNGEAIVAELRGLLGAEVAVSRSGDQLLFSLVPLAATMARETGPADLARARQRLLTRPCLLCQDGFHRWDPTVPGEPRRARYQATMRLVNAGAEPRHVTVTMNWQRESPHEIDVHVRGSTLNFDRHFHPELRAQRLSIDLTLLPGEHVLRFDSSPSPFGLPRMYCAWSATKVGLTVHD